MLTAVRRSFAPLVAAAAFGCADQAAGPSLNLVGEWAVVGFADDGVNAEVEGDARFFSYGSYTFDVTMQFPNEPPFYSTAAGTWEMVGEDRVTLHNRFGGMISYHMVPDGDRLVMTSYGVGPRITLTLRSTAR